MIIQIIQIFWLIILFRINYIILKIYFYITTEYQKIVVLNYLENYNGYLKKELGKHRIINWINFIHFIKQESQRSIEKLLNLQNYNMSNDYIDFSKNITLNENNSIYNLEEKSIWIKA